MPELAPLHVITATSQRDAGSRDLWVANAIAALRAEPVPLAAGVLRPTSTEQLATTLRSLAADGSLATDDGALLRPTGLVALGAGSGVCGAVRPGSGDVVIDLKALRGVAIDGRRGIGRFGAGVLGSHAEAAANAAGLTIGHFPSSIATSTVGGWLAARGAGQLSSRYGKIEDIAVGATAVTAAGDVVRATRGEAALGEWIGSEGALALLTEVELRLWPLRQGWTLRGFRAPSLEAALQLGCTLVRSRPVPSVLRVYDPVDSRIALSHRGSSGRGGITRHLPLMLRAPRLVDLAMRNVLRRCLVIVGWEGDGPGQQAALAQAQALAAAAGAIDLGAGPGETWLHRRHDVSFKAIGILRDGLFADTVEMAAPWSRVEAVYRAVCRAVLPDALAMSHFSHAWSEGCALYFSMSGRVDRYADVWRRALEAGDAAGATISHHHGVGRLKAPLLARELGGAWPVLQARKDAWDPGGLLNPGVLGLGAPAEDATARARIPALDARLADVAPSPRPFRWADGAKGPAAAPALSGPGPGALFADDGLWQGPLDAPLGEVEALVRAGGWTLGVDTDAPVSVGAWLQADLCTPAATSVGSARDRLVALQGCLADGAAFATRNAPRHAAGPDLRPALLALPDAGGRLDVALLRLQRWPGAFLRLEAEGHPLDLSNQIWPELTPFATSYVAGRLRAWLPWATPADQAMGGPLRAAWLAGFAKASSDFAGPDLALRPARWRPWAAIEASSLLVGLEPAGAFVVHAEAASAPLGGWT